jgi:hypothetical protein
MARRFEPPHLPFPLPGRLVRDFGPVVEPLVLPMLDTRQDLRLRGAITLHFVRHQHPRHILQSLEQLAEKAFGCLPVAPALHQHIERMAVLVDRAPQVMMLAFDGQHHLVQMPFITALGLASAPDSVTSGNASGSS